MELSLKDKNILFLCTSFFSYREIIVESLKKKGANVYFFENKLFAEDWRCSTNLLFTMVRYLINPSYKNKYTSEILKQIEGVKIDIFFAINGFCVTKKLIEQLKVSNPNIKTIIYNWDSFYYWKYQNVISWFDKKYSFDWHDCQENKDKGLTYQPNFYVAQNKQNSSNFVYDIVFIGSGSLYSSDRMKIVKSIISFCQKKRLNYYVKLYSAFELRQLLNIKKLLYYLSSFDHLKYVYRWLDAKMTGVLTKDMLQLSDVLDIESKAKVIIDIPLEHQQGHPIRSIEAIAAGKKLCTFNKSVINDVFYNPDMIYIVDRGKEFFIPDSFFNARPNPIDINYLYIDNWIETILN